MASGPWTGEENDLIVADYFAMLADDIAGRRYSKAEHRRALLPLLNDRSEGSVEFKHQNISAVLKGLGEDWIPGYKPAFNFQMTLVDAVARWLALHPDWLGRLPGMRAATGMREAAQIWIGPPPTLSNQPPPQELDQMLHIARKFDVAGRDERNRALGRAGEERVLAHEHATLRAAGRDDLARKVRWVSEEDGDGAGYDIASYAPDGRPRLIEVKTTNGWERTPFHITRNELAVADEGRAEWCLFRMWNFSREPRAFELYPPLDGHVSLTPTSFQASFRCSSVEHPRRLLVQGQGGHEARVIGADGALLAAQGESLEDVRCQPFEAQQAGHCPDGPPPGSYTWSSSWPLHESASRSRRQAAILDKFGNLSSLETSSRQTAIHAS